MEPVTVYTIGHSTRSSEEFLQLLQSHGVQQLVDVRTVPRSRHNPQFNQDTLPATLAGAGVLYAHLPELGGLRKARPDSINDAWENASFRGYADYMQTPEFAAGLERLLALARERPTVVMCAEAVPWRCHRWLIADALTVRGVPVRHILGPRRADLHRLHPLARAEGGRIVYR